MRRDFRNPVGSHCRTLSPTTTYQNLEEEAIPLVEEELAHRVRELSDMVRWLRKRDGRLLSRNGPRRENYKESM